MCLYYEHAAADFTNYLEFYADLTDYNHKMLFILPSLWCQGSSENCEQISRNLVDRWEI